MNQIKRLVVNISPLEIELLQDCHFGVLVVEAGYRSGASLTATIAKGQGKKVFCIPSNINSKYTRTNDLIKKGAILVTSAEDILKELDIEKRKKTTDNFSRLEKTFRNDISQKERKEVKILPQYRKVYEQLSYEKIHINEICKKTDTDISEVSGILTILELEGHIKQLPGKMFELL